MFNPKVAPKVWQTFLGQTCFFSFFGSVFFLIHTRTHKGAMLWKEAFGVPQKPTKKHGTFVGPGMDELLAGL